MLNLSQLEIGKLDANCSNTMEDLCLHQTKFIFGSDNTRNVYKLSLGKDKYVKLETGSKKLSDADAYTLALAHADYKAGKISSYGLVNVANQFGRARHGRDSYN